jgi:ABC-type sugar transport system ATPase subunit
MAAIELKGLTRTFAGGVAAVDRCALAVADGEYLVILGPSGCGKTTLLRLIAGLDRPDAGEIFIAGTDVRSVPPHQRGIGMVFQDSALYPHMTVRKNLAFPLTTRRVTGDEIASRLNQIASLLRLDGLLDRKPGELSGGERQRVALGRALIIQPRALLLDEPLSHLDAHLRDDLRRELRQVHQQLRPTIIHVTHDQDEAIELGERLAVMAAGRVQQVGTPREVHDQPANRFVAGFIGRPRMNLLDGMCRTDGDHAVFVMRGGGQFDLARVLMPAPTGGQREVVLGIRPEAIRLEDAEDAQRDAARISATVTAVRRGMSGLFADVSLQDGALVSMKWPDDREPPAESATVNLAIRFESIQLFEPGQFGRAIRTTVERGSDRDQPDVPRT